MSDVPNHEANRFNDWDRLLIHTRIANRLAVLKGNGFLEAELYTEAAQAIGCSILDLRESEIEDIASIIKGELG